jgi:hypothetical protein
MSQSISTWLPVSNRNKAMLYVFQKVGVQNGIVDSISTWLNTSDRRDQRRRDDMADIKAALTRYKQATGSYPSTGDAWTVSEPNNAQVSLHGIITDPIRLDRSSFGYTANNEKSRDARYFAARNSVPSNKANRSLSLCRLL